MPKARPPYPPGFRRWRRRPGAGFRGSLGAGGEWYPYPRESHPSRKLSTEPGQVQIQRAESTLP